MASPSQVMEGLSPVLEADAVAVVAYEDNTMVEIPLRDDGVAPDNVRSDGIYSAYFTQFRQSGQESRLQVSCKVEGDNTTTVVSGPAAARAFPARPSPSTPMCCGSSAVNDDTPRSPTGAFARSRSGGVIKVDPFDPATDMYPPGPVRDLSAAISDDLNTLELSFTSPGGQLDLGTVQSYMIFYSSNKTDLDSLSPASTVAQISPSDCDCSLQPQPPRSEVKLSLNITTFTQDQKTFFRVLLLNDADKTSQSNTAGVFLPSFPVPNAPLGLTWGIAIAIFLGSMGATFLVVGAVFWHKWFYKW